MATSERPAVAPPDGLRLPDRYRVRRHLASGGMASVWCAEDLVLGRAVAIKVLAERFREDEMAMRRFKREARAAARVSNHGHVVSIFDVGDLAPDGGFTPTRPPRPFIVMEYLAGGTVADALRVGAVRRQEAVRWIREAASALDHAHARGIVHRDIKPANFLLNRSRVLHVADFGIARLVSEDTITSAGELFGTAAYLSPEQALGREATGASDRYALAVAAFELLTGERPFSAQHFAAQARQHVEQPPPRASERDRTLPPSLDEVLMRGMAKQPDERFESAGAFVDAMETALSGGIPITTRAVAFDRDRGRELPRTVARSAAADGSVVGHMLSSPKTAWSPADSLQRGASAPARGRRAAALAALVVAIGVVGVVVVNGLGGHSRRGRITADRLAPRRGSTSATAARTTPKPAPQVTATHPASTTAGVPTSTAVSADPQVAQQLQLTGHQEILAGQYQTAITTLRRAVSAAPPGSLTYAYGLYDLGRAMVLAGDPQGAVPILEKRLQIPNQTAVVQEELEQALAASGQTTSPSGTSASDSSSSDSSSSDSASSSATSTSSSTPPQTTTTTAPSTGGQVVRGHRDGAPGASSGGAGLAGGQGQGRRDGHASGDEAPNFLVSFVD